MKIELKAVKIKSFLLVKSHTHKHVVGVELTMWPNIAVRILISVEWWWYECVNCIENEMKKENTRSEAEDCIWSHLTESLRLGCCPCNQSTTTFYYSIYIFVSPLKIKKKSE